MIASRPKIPNQIARAIFLDRHLLSSRTLSQDYDLQRIIDRLGFVQVDSINTVERAHHMILAARSNRYRPKHLVKLLERDRGLFEHWTHDASLVPTGFYPFWRLRFERDAEQLRKNWKNWRRDGFEEKFGEVLERIRTNGPTMAREVGDGEARANGGWWDWHPSKTALEFLWRTGKLAVCRREGFQKVFDLTERVIPEAHLTPRPSPAETIGWACSSALDRLGFATSGEIAAFWKTVTPAEAKEWCLSRLGTDLVEVEVGDADGKSWRTMYARPDITADIADPPDLPGGVKILSPFDPALRDRRRAERLFGFHYRIEIFVPAEKRKYGYYIFPVLEKDRLIGRIDMKRQGATGRLEVAAFWPEVGIRMGKGRLDRLDSQLHRVARFSGCDCVVYSDGWLRAPLGT
ncbi:YcaQ family DNA glycosylase [Rhodobacteraceae bacterium NNCM2]|nr:YcaQ family DNA glycosylase [Coraliihabitans acroporae]